MLGMTLGLALLATACNTGGGEPAADGAAAKDCTWTIGTMGALSGDYASLGAPIAEGVEFAVNEANARGDLACRLEYQPEDSQGSSDQAPGLAQNLVQTETLVACICPLFSGETVATGSIFSEANVLITGTGTAPNIADQDFTTWFRAVANDNLQGITAAQYISEKVQPSSVAIVHDGSEYGKGVADVTMERLGDVARGPFQINPEETDYSAVVAQVKNVQPDAVFYGGYNPQAGTLLRQLREFEVGARYFSVDGAKDPTFGDRAGKFAEGAIVTCACADPLKVEGAQGFVEGMRAEFGEDAPGTFAADVYDVTTFVIDALSELNGDEPIAEVRQHVIDHFRNAEDLQGITKTYTWDDKGELQADPLEDVWIYEWSSGEENFVSLGRAADEL